MALSVTEILDVIRQGKTKPVLCCAEDKRIFVVKGAYAGRKALVSEWLAGSLARNCGLPVPQFELLQIPAEFFRYSGQYEELQLLGRGMLFGSAWQENLVELRHSNVQQVDPNLRARVLAFDWWTGNDDRILTDSGGNPNLLWSDVHSKLTVIDHNLAFEYGEMSGFWEHHVFREDRNLWTPALRAELEAEFRLSLAMLDEIWNNLPDDWLEDLDTLSLTSVRTSLSRFESNQAKFWCPL